MCLALPARVVECLPDQMATVELGGVRKTINIALTPEAQPGDYVIVHVGFAIGLLDPEEAERTLALFAELEATDPATGQASDQAIDQATTGATA